MEECLGILAVRNAQRFCIIDCEVGHHISPRAWRCLTQRGTHIPSTRSHASIDGKTYLLLGVASVDGNNSGTERGEKRCGVVLLPRYGARLPADKVA